MNSENSPPGKGLWGGCQMSFVIFIGLADFMDRRELASIFIVTGRYLGNKR